MRIGTKVICVDDANIDARIPNKPECGKEYHIRDIISYVVNKPGQKGALLKEISNPLVTNKDGMKHEPSFNINRFVELDSLGAAYNDKEEEFQDFMKELYELQEWANS